MHMDKILLYFLFLSTSQLNRFQQTMTTVTAAAIRRAASLHRPQRQSGVQTMTRVTAAALRRAESFNRPRQPFGARNPTETCHPASGQSGQTQQRQWQDKWGIVCHFSCHQEQDSALKVHVRKSPLRRKTDLQAPERGNEDAPEINDIFMHIKFLTHASKKPSWKYKKQKTT